MATFSSPFLSTLESRGFIHQCTDEGNLDTLLTSGKPTPAYIGFDCTAPSLHVGSLLQIMTLRHYQKAGHKPIVLMGGGTTKVGDPSGKDESRKLLDGKAIEENMNGIKAVFSKFIEFEESFNPNSTKAVMVNNADWLDSLNYIDFLRDYGRHFSINRMLTMESVKMRLEREQHLSFLEFNYMILQAYDFVELNKNYGCRLQIGGSDQWGNIVSGTELNRRSLGQEDDISKELFGLTTPLITTSSGAKMGKTAQGAVWLNADMTSPYDYWQFWRNTEDADVTRFLKFFTELSDEEISKLEALEGADINKAKIVLANAATTLCHGVEAAQNAEQTARQTFEQGGTGGELPVIEVAKSELESGIEAFRLFVEADLAESNGKARKLIQQGGGRVNNVKIADENQKITLSDIDGEGIKLSAGKKKHVLVKAS